MDVKDLVVVDLSINQAMNRTKKRKMIHVSDQKIYLDLRLSLLFLILDGAFC